MNLSFGHRSPVSQPTRASAVLATIKGGEADASLLRTLSLVELAEAAHPSLLPPSWANGSRQSGLVLESQSTRKLALVSRTGRFRSGVNTLSSGSVPVK